MLEPKFGRKNTTYNTEEFRGEEKGSKKKNTSDGFYFLRKVAG